MIQRDKKPAIGAIMFESLFPEILTNTIPNVSILWLSDAVLDFATTKYFETGCSFCSAM